MKYFPARILLISIGLLFLGIVVTVSPAHALPGSFVQLAASDSRGDACNGLSQLGGTSCGGGEGGLSQVLSGVVTIISYLAGIIAVIMIIISGIRYTTSGGDSAKVGAAKTALVYALIGIAIAGLAQVLVHFVIGASVNGVHKL